MSTGGYAFEWLQGAALMDPKRLRWPVGGRWPKWMEMDLKQSSEPTEFVHMKPDGTKDWLDYVDQWALRGRRLQNLDLGQGNDLRSLRNPRSCQHGRSGSTCAVSSSMRGAEASQTLAVASPGALRATPGSGRHASPCPCTAPSDCLSAIGAGLGSAEDGGRGGRQRCVPREVRLGSKELQRHGAPPNRGLYSLYR